MDAHLQEVFATAVANLANDKLTVRVGGIVALKQLADREVQFLPQVRAIFASFVRETQDIGIEMSLAPDIQEVLSYLAEFEEDT